MWLNQVIGFGVSPDCNKDVSWDVFLAGGSTEEESIWKLT